MVVPFVRRGGRHDLQAEDALVYAEHPVQRLLVREKHAKLLGVHGVLLLLEQVHVVEGIPHVEGGVGVAGFAAFQRVELRKLGLPLRLEAALEAHQEFARRGAVAGHLDFTLVVGPRLVAELGGDRGAELQDGLEQRDVFLAGQPLALAGDAFARGLRLGAAHDVEVVKRHVGLERVLVVAGLDLLEETFRQPLELRGRELQFLLGVGDVGAELGRRGGELLAEPFDLVALGLGQVQAGPSIVAQRLLEQPLGLAAQPGRRVGVRLDHAVHILAIVEADGPLVELLDRLGGLGAVLGVLAGFLEHVGAVGHQRQVKPQIVERADRVVEGRLAWLDFADGIEPFVGCCDRRVNGVARGLWRGLERRQRDSCAVALGQALELRPVAGETGA